MITLQTFARECFQKTTESILKTFAAVPDDKLNWSPSDTSRSAVRLVSHVGICNELLASFILEEPVKYADVGEFMTDMLQREKAVKTRSEALALIETTTPKIVSAIDNVKDSRLLENVQTIFGPHLMRKIIFFPEWHASAHLGQLEYLQTIWGDLEMHG